MYECRVTIEPVFDERLDTAKYISRQFNFKVGNQSHNETFMTSHGAVYEILDARMQLLVDALTRHDFEVLRYKIEKIIINSK